MQHKHSRRQPKAAQSQSPASPSPAQRFSPSPDQGLRASQVEQRVREGLTNGSGAIKTQSERDIILKNVITPFNILNFVLAALVLLVGSFKNMLFMGVILCNILIGSFQEIRAKHTIDKLSLVAAPRAHVVRDGKLLEIPVEEIVLDDILRLSAGGQVCADCILVSGQCEVNESLLTGESDPIVKGPGDLLLSGSFVVSGSCLAKAEHVGADNYASQITNSAKYVKKPNSEILYWINRIIKWVSVVIAPVGLLLFCKQYFLTDSGIQDSVVSTVAALVGMIPEGLVLLTSVVLAVSVLRLARRRALVQDLYSIETLARVDVLCLDKTGTITEGSMQLDELVPLDGADPAELRAVIAAMTAANGDANPTFTALREGCGAPVDWKAEQVVPFSSARKWSGVSFHGHGSYILGAGEFILRDRFSEIRETVEAYAQKGSRVLLLAHSPHPFGDKTLPDAPEPLALVLLSDKIRASAPETLRYFSEQGVTLKVISGDDAATAASIAGKAGLPCANRFIDASALSPEQLREAAEDYTVFGRVTPDQKRILVKALQDRGHTVAMTGDGANDVMALRESDCSVAMAAGSEAARSVANLVLLDSDFASMPHVVREGRRAINNLQRSAALFLVKSIFSGVIAVCFLFLSAAYPFEPIQFTLINAATIGIPSFLLALEPNKERIRGHFISNVLRQALPGAAAMILGLLLLLPVSAFLDLDAVQLSTMAVCQTAFAGFLTLVKISRPLNAPRAVLCVAMVTIFCAAIVLFRDLFSLTVFTVPMAVALVPLLAAAAAVFIGMHHLIAAASRGKAGDFFRRLRTRFSEEDQTSRR